MDRRRFLKKAGIGSVALASVPALQQALTTAAEASGGADHVRWDIVNVDIPITTLSAGGVAYASVNSVLKIKLTGSGTFVVPASGGTSDAVTGGGTWETFANDVSTAGGTYKVTGLASWQFANLQTPGLKDQIGDVNQRANGTAVLRIAYSDGSQGTLGIGCHGPGAPESSGADPTQEGVVATKGYFTYWTREAPPANGNKNRTLFHLTKGAAGTSASAPSELVGTTSGSLAGNSGGSFNFYQITSPTGATLTLMFNYNPFDAGQAHAIGVAVYQNGSKLGSVTGQAGAEGNATNTSAVSLVVTPSASGGPVLIQVFNYSNYTAGYTLTTQ